MRSLLSFRLRCQPFGTCLFSKFPLALLPKLTIEIRWVQIPIIYRLLTRLFALRRLQISRGQDPVPLIAL